MSPPREESLQTTSIINIRRNRCLFQGNLLSRRADGKCDNAFHGSIQEVDTDVEVMGRTEVGSTEKSHFLPELFSNTFQAKDIDI